MHISKLRNKYILLPAAIVTLGALVGASSQRTPVRCIQDIAFDWAQKNRATIPTTLGQFSKFNLAYRHAIYHELSPDQHASLWREHLNSFLGSSSILSASQQATVRALLTKLDFYMHAPREAARTALERDGFTNERLQAEFGGELARVVFADPGARVEDIAPREEGQASARAAVVAGVDSVRTEGVVEPALPPICECAKADPYCGQNCCETPAESGCQHTNGCCGTLLLFDCDGLCFAC